MTNPIHPGGLPIPPPGPEGIIGPARKPSAGENGGNFKEILLDSLERVNALQQDADNEVQGLISGKTQDVAEVFSAVRKSEVAFSLLMEIRNKLTDAYQEIQQIRF